MRKHVAHVDEVAVQRCLDEDCMASSGSCYGGLYLYGPKSMHSWRRSQSYNRPIVGGRRERCRVVRRQTAGGGWRERAEELGSAPRLAAVVQTLSWDRLLPYRDSRDSLGVLHSQSCQRRLVAVLRLDSNGSLKEADKIECVFSGDLPDMIHGNIVLKPKTMQEANRMAQSCMDKRVSTMAERQVKKEDSWKTLPEANRYQQYSSQTRCRNTGRAYSAGSVDRTIWGI
ncbi:hypothetical protein Tco_1203082 [Tanacetum coccineum]